MEDGVKDIVVSNTFTQGWEMEDYYKMAEELGYRVFSLIVENRHGGENIHTVPKETIKKMKDRFKLKL
jgi:phenolic acid decarboxylase